MNYFTFAQAFEDFLKHNTQLVYKDNPFSPQTNHKSVGMIVKEDLLEFKNKIKNALSSLEEMFKEYPEKEAFYLEQTNILDGNTKDERRFITSNWGLFYVLDRESKFEHFVEHGYNIVWPDTVKEYMELGVIPYNATVLKNIKAKDNAWVKNKMAAREERKAHEAAKAEEFKRVKQELNQTLGEGLANRILGFDIFYEYSDDRVVYKSGLAREKELSEEIRKLGHDPKTILVKVRKAKTM